MSRFPADAYRAELLYDAFVRSGRHDPKLQAGRGGLSYDLLAKLWEGERNVLASHIEKILRSTQDDTLAAKLAGFDRCGRVVMPLPRAETGPDDYRAATCDLTAKLGKLAADEQVGLAGDNFLDRNERAVRRGDLERLVAAATTELGRLDAIDKAEDERPVPLRGRR